MGKVKVWLMLLVLSSLLVGCQDMEYLDWGDPMEGEEVFEQVENYRYEDHETRSKIMYVYTEEQTYVWGTNNITFKESDTGKDYVKYIRNENGDIGNREYYIAKENIKDYSTKYAELFSATLKIVPEGEKEIEEGDA